MVSNFENNLSEELEAVYDENRAKQQAAQQAAQEARQAEIKLQEERAKAHGVQIRFREDVIKPCFKAIQAKIPGSFGREYGDNGAGWQCEFDDSEIDLSISYHHEQFTITVRGVVGTNEMYCEQTTYHASDFTESEAKRWLEEHALACTKATVEESGFVPNVVRYIG